MPYYYSSEETWDIGYSLYNLMTLKILHDHGYDVKNVEFWVDWAFGGDSADDMIWVIFERIFELKKDDVIYDQSKYRYEGYAVHVPIILRLRYFETTPLNRSKKVTRYIKRLEKKLQSIFEDSVQNICFDGKISISPTGFALLYDPHCAEIYDMIEPLINLKKQVDAYIEKLERSERECQQPLISA